MEKEKIIVKMEFDDYEYAKDVRDKAAQKLVKVKRGFIIAAVASVMSFFSLVVSLGAISDYLLPIALLGSIVAYIIGGGFSIALKSALRLATIGLIVCTFPLNLFVGLLTMVLSVVCFLFFPVVFVFINYRQYKQNYDDADIYIKHFKEVE